MTKTKAIDKLIETLKKVLNKKVSEIKIGDLFELKIETRKGPVDILAEIVIEGDTLHLKDIVVYAEAKKPLSGLEKEILKTRTRLIETARKLGFKKLKMTGTRHPKSTSAKPGKKININVKL
jgi:hypothetical protein